MRFKIDWASLIVGSKFTFFALFYFVFEGNFPSTSPQGGNLIEGFLPYQFGGLIFGGAYTYGGAYFRNFTVFLLMCKLKHSGEGRGGGLWWQERSTPPLKVGMFCRNKFRTHCTDIW